MSSRRSMRRRHHEASCIHRRKRKQHYCPSPFCRPCFYFCGSSCIQGHHQQARYHMYVLNIIFGNNAIHIGRLHPAKTQHPEELVLMHTAGNSSPSWFGSFFFICVSVHARAMCFSCVRPERVNSKKTKCCVCAPVRETAEIIPIQVLRVYIYKKTPEYMFPQGIHMFFIPGGNRCWLC